MTGRGERVIKFGGGADPPAARVRRRRGARGGWQGGRRGGWQGEVRP